MKISIIGIRGIPFIYSGFESFAENLSTSLIDNGWDVDVYCRRNYFDNKYHIYKGTKRIFIPTFYNKYFETFFHSLISTLHSIFLNKPDAIIYFGLGSTPFALIAKSFRIPTLLNVDGMDWKRAKWNIFGKAYLYLCSRIATYCADIVITDSRLMQRHYQNSTVYIPYGVPGNDKERPANRVLLKNYNLQKHKFVVWVGRLVPENNVEELLASFTKTDTSYKCVIVGDDLYESPYVKKIHSLAKKDSRILLTGFLDRSDYLTLLKSCICYIETKRSGGTHPSLIEALQYSNLIISNDYPANQEILGSAAIFYHYQNPVTDLSQVLTRTLTLSAKEKKTYYIKMHKRIEKEYEWTSVVSQYIDLLLKLHSR